MGACNMTQSIITNHEIIHQDQLADDSHQISSAMLTKSNFDLFEAHPFRTTNSETLQTLRQHENQMFLSIENELTYFDKIEPNEHANFEVKQNFEEKTLPFDEKQNIFSKNKTSFNKLNKSIKITGDFFKIKQKQACAEYKVLAKIANKKIGQLYKVIDKTTNQVRSLQIIKQDEASQKTLHQINLLKKFDHPNIYHLTDVFLKKGFYYIIGQYIQGDNILCLNRENEVISERGLSKVIKQVFQALNYLHYRGIMHRNIKPETVVFQTKIVKNKDSFPAIKLINFKQSVQIKHIRQQVDNLYFMAPEVFIGSHNQKCDIWSVGVIIYLLITGQLPFNGENKQQIQKNVVGNDLCFQGKIWQNKSQSLKSLLKKILHKSPSRRISAKEALASNWFNEASQNDKIRMSKGTMKNLFCNEKDKKFEAIIKNYLVKMTTPMEERQEMAKKFQSIDLDKSGFIDKKQLIQAYKEIHGKNISKCMNVDEIIHKIDINKSGMIDFSEFMAAISKIQTLFATERLEKAFQFIDRDGTGEIQTSEIIQLLHNELENEGSNEQDAQITEIMKQFDHNGDNKISKKQFIDFFLKAKQSHRTKNISQLEVDTTQ